MNKTYFRFPVTIVKSKCYTTPTVNKDGTAGDPVRHLVAVASSDSLDSYREYFSLSALTDMVDWARVKKVHIPAEGVVELRTTHWSTFAIGTIVDGWLTKNEKTGAIEFFIDIALKDEPWEANELYRQVHEGTADKQLSVGGWIDWDASDDAFDYEEREFTDSSGEAITFWVGRINRFILEHVAATLNGFAANDDSRFIEALVKSMDDKDYQLRSRNHEQVTRATAPASPNAGSGIDSQLMPLLREIRDFMSTSKSNTESEDSMDKNKAAKAAKLLREKLSGATPEEISEILRDAGIVTDAATVTPPVVPAVAPVEAAKTTDAVTPPAVVPPVVPAVEKSTDTPPAVTPPAVTPPAEAPAVAKSTDTPPAEAVPPVVKTGDQDVPQLIKAAIEVATATLRTEIASLRGEIAKQFATDSIVRDSISGRMDTIEKSHGVMKSTGKEAGEDVIERGAVETGTPTPTQGGTLWNQY